MGFDTPLTLEPSGPGASRSVGKATAAACAARRRGVTCPRTVPVRTPSVQCPSPRAPSRRCRQRWAVSSPSARATRRVRGAGPAHDAIGAGKTFQTPSTVISGSRPIDTVDRAGHERLALARGRRRLVHRTSADHRGRARLSMTWPSGTTGHNLRCRQNPSQAKFQLLRARDTVDLARRPVADEERPGVRGEHGQRVRGIRAAPSRRYHRRAQMPSQ